MSRANSFEVGESSPAKRDLPLPFSHLQHELPSLDGVLGARKRLAAYVPVTPFFRSEVLTEKLGFDLWLKVETINPISSFKLRGALNAILTARESGASITGAVTSSTGNHGQGVAYAARLLGILCHVFVPDTANPVKLDRIRIFGASIHQAGADIDEAKRMGLAFASERRWMFIDDGEDLEMMNGAGTVGLEMVDALPSVQEVFVPMGSGTLVSGCASAIKTRSRQVRVTAVQSSGAPAMTLSFLQRASIEHEIETIADGLVCRIPAKRALDALVHWIDDAVLVSDDELVSALRLLAATEHLLVEPSGAAGLAAVMKQQQELQGRKVAVVLTGSNLAPGVFEPR